MALSTTHVMAERLMGLERTVEQLNARLAYLQEELNGRSPSKFLFGFKEAVQWKRFSAKHPWPNPRRSVRENKRVVSHDRA